MSPQRHSKQLKVPLQESKKMATETGVGKNKKEFLL
jgi:hypothetical protein